VDAQPAPLSLPELFVRAQQAQGAGRLAEAAAVYQAILTRDPQHADATHYLGMLALQAGELERAQALVAASLALRPRDGFYWMNQGLIHQRCNDTERAVTAYQTAVRYLRDNAELWLSLGNGLMQLRRLDEAIAAFEQSITIADGDWQAWTNRGTCLLLRHRDERDAHDALMCFERTIRLAPTRGEGYNGKGLALLTLERLPEALTSVQRAVQVDPSLANGWYNLARIHLDMQDVEAALDAYDQALAISPDTTEFYAAIGDTLSMLGKFDQAQTFFERASARHPDDFGALAQVLNNEETPERVARAEAAVAAVDDDAPGIEKLLFILGRIYDKRDAFDQAFAYYARGNRIRRQSESFDRAAFSTEIDALIATWSAEKIAALKPLGDASERPVLILGMPRSGTTLTEQIVSSHSRVSGGEERSFWADASARLASGAWRLNKPGMRELAQACLADLASIKGANERLRVTDKMPHNFLRVGLIHSVFPNARIIHCRRNPVDNCLSIFFQSFGGHHPYAYDLDDLAFYHREYQRLMAHWRSTIPADRLFEFDYEDMVADQENMSRRLIDFIGLDWEDACLDFDRNDRLVRTASIRQVREKIYTRSVERWRNYAPHIAPLLSLLPPDI
jgi:tetratricopeptide (TPR) repeat protein